MNKNTWQLTEKTEDWGRKDENGMKVKNKRTKSTIQKNICTIHILCNNIHINTYTIPYYAHKYTNPIIYLPFWKKKNHPFI